MKTIKLFALFLFLPTFCLAQNSLDSLSLKSIFYEPLLAGNRPDFTSFSPDESHVYFQANDSALTDEEHFKVNLQGINTMTAPEKFEPDFSTSPDGKKLVYEKNRDIWIADPNFENKRQLIHSQDFEYNASWAPDSRRIGFIQEGDVWIINVANSKLRQVTDKKEGEPGYTIIDWAGNDKLVLLQLDTSDYEEYYFPEYLSRYVRKGTARRGVAKQSVCVAYLDSGKVKQQYEQKGYISTATSATGRYLAVDFIDPPKKHRIITVFDLVESTSPVVFEDSTKGWIYATSLAFAPKGDRLMFRSEKDGWNHIYTIDTDGRHLQQHTRGSFEISWVQWLDENNIAYVSNETDPGEQHIYTLNLENNAIQKLTSTRGYRQNFHLSRNKKYMVYQYSYFNQPFELYALNLKSSPRETRLTYTTPDRFKKIDWQKEDYIRFTARDGQTKLSMSVLKPRPVQQGEKYPVIVFAHGAGSLQNVYKGWSDHYYREYMFHQYLTARGYFVIEVDFRHSTGYGRDFREDVTNWMGKYETRDIVDGLRYLGSQYAEADTSNVGIYGGSYGGFMALYAASVNPSYFDAAAALRAVTNWQNYYYTNPWYTLPRLGEPKADSVHYARSSPISYVDSLEQPVLILHGLMDNNVGFQNAAQYIDKLVQSGDKEFDMMIYPSERHSFQDADAWYDEYSRIYEFFEENLK